MGTLHRYKGLEYQHMIVAGVSDALVPNVNVDRHKDSDPARYRRELQMARSLLFVAATRARDSLVLSWHGEPSRFLPEQTAPTADPENQASGKAVLEDGALFPPSDTLM